MILLVIIAALCAVDGRVSRRNHIGALNVGILARQRQGFYAPHLNKAHLDLRNITFQTFTQRLDHFDSQNSQTWSQRYLVNNTFCTADTFVSGLLRLGRRRRHQARVCHGTLSLQ